MYADCGTPIAAVGYSTPQGLSFIHNGSPDDLAAAQAKYYSMPPELRDRWCMSRELYESRIADHFTARVEIATSGECCKLSYKHLAGAKSNARRGACAGFSDRSRIRLSRRVLQIDQSVHPERSWLFVTLTYPAVWPPDFSEWKRHLKNWSLRLNRLSGGAGFLWKLEPQRRGAPHFHLLLSLPSHCRQQRTWLKAFRLWLSKSWHEVVGCRAYPEHLRAGTNAQMVRSLRGTRAYAAKYMAKSFLFCDENGEEVPAGRFWGCVRLHYATVVHNCPEFAAKRWKRSVRKYLEKTRGFRIHHRAVDPHASMYAYVPQTIAERLLKHYSPWGLTGAAGAQQQWQGVRDATVGGVAFKRDGILKADRLQSALDAIPLTGVRCKILMNAG